MNYEGGAANMPNTCDYTLKSYVLVMCEILKFMACLTQRTAKNTAFFHFWI